MFDTLISPDVRKGLEWFGMVKISDTEVALARIFSLTRKEVDKSNGIRSWSQVMVGVNISCDRRGCMPEFNRMRR
jgi:hypothetical protein